MTKSACTRASLIPYPVIRLYQRKRQKGARNATHEQKAVVGMTPMSWRQFSLLSCKAIHATAHRQS